MRQGSSVRSSTYLLSVLCIGSACSAAAAETYRVPEHDLRIALDLSPLVQGLAGLEGAYYRAHWSGCKPGGHILVDVHSRPELQLTPTRHWIDARIGAELLLRTTFHADLQGPACHPSVGSNCSLTGCLGPLSRPGALDLTGQCVFTPLGLISFAFPISVALPTVLYEGLSLSLNPINETTSGRWTRMEFGTLSGGTWTPTGTTLVIPLLINTTVVGASSARTLIIDATIGQRVRRVAFADEPAAEAAVAADMPLWDNSSLGVSVGIPFFSASAMQAANKGGLVDRLLPMKIYGQESASGEASQEIFGYELYVDTAVVVLQPNPAGGAAVSTFSVQQPRIWKINPSTNQRENGIIHNAAAHVTLSQPILDSSTGQLSLAVREFAISIDATFGSQRVHLAPAHLESVLNGGVIPLGDLRPTFKPELPQCVDVGGDTVEAWSACPDGHQTGRLSFQTPEKVPQWTLQSDQVRARIANQALQVSVPIVTAVIPNTPGTARDRGQMPIH